MRALHSGYDVGNILRVIEGAARNQVVAPGRRIGGYDSAVRELAKGEVYPVQ
jgi:hypothetical protein